MSDFEKFRIKGIDYNVADAEARANKVSRCSEFPEITAENDGEIVQFVGTSTETYTNGYFYKANLSENTWEPCPVQEADPLPESEADSLFGTNDNNEAVAYKAGKGIILEKVVLPDEYTEVEYIESDWANEAHVEEISTDRITVSCNVTYPRKPYISFFEQASQFVHFEVVSAMFECIDFNGYTNWKIHCYDKDGNEALYYEHESTSGLHQYWLIDVQGDIQFGDYFILERTGWDRRQYIDTGVVLNTILDYEWDKTNGRSYNYSGVNVEINPTAEFDEYMRNGGYIKFKAQNDGMTDNFAYGLNGSYTSVASAAWIKEHYGIDITGDIVYASYDAAEAVHTVIWLNRIPSYPRYIIHTSAYVEDITNTYLKVLGANNGNNSGIFCNLNGISNYYGWKTFYLSYASLGLPAYKGWNDITIDNATTQSYGWQQATVNGNSLLQSYTSCYDSSNVLLFTANMSGSAATSSSLKMKRTTIQKDGVIVFDGVPAIRNSDGVAGMYDVANNVFKTSESVNDFVAGPVAVYPRIEVEETTIKNDYGDEVEVVKGFENDEYVQLTWLKSNGSQVIDLGISGAANHEYEICFKCDGLGSSTTGNSRPLFGIYSTTVSQTPGYALKLLNNKLYRVFATGGVGSEQEVCGWDDDWHVVRTKKNYTAIDGVETRNISSSDNYIDSSWGLFGVKTGSSGNWSFPSPYSYFVGKISYFRDYCSGILVREFVPVRRKSDGQLGFYCIQEDRFCPNVITGYQEGFQGGEIFGTRVIKKNTSDILPGESIYNTIQKQRVNTFGNLAYSYQTSYGSNARPDGPYTTVIGANASATSSTGRNTVVGANAETGSYYNTLVGVYSIAQGANSTVIGYASRTDGSCSVVVGNCRGRDNSSTYTTGNYTVSIGYGIGARGSAQSVFIGNSIGLSNLSSGNVTWAVCVGDNAQIGANYGIAIGPQANIHSGAVNSVAIGSNAHAYSIHSIALGNSATVNYSSNYSTAIGYHATVEANYGIQLGYGYNNETATFYVGFGTSYGNYKLLGSNGVIPYERLTTATAVDGYCLKYDANSNSLVWGEAGGSYTLPIASSSTLGGIKVGSGLSINSSTGVLSATAQALQPATANRLGGIKVGNGLSVENDGTLSADVQSNNFEDIGGNPYDNQALSDALNGLQNNIDGVESDLQSQIDNISSIGEFLAIWDCDTGIARYLNAGFVYPTGGYFIIGSVAAQGQPNYMPDGSTYTGPSTTTTPEDVKVSDMWFYDGTHWIYLANHERQIAVDADLSTTSINPVQNRTITAALEDKIEKSSDPSVIYGTDENGDQTVYEAGNGIVIEDGKISTKSDSVGVPQIANIYSKQVNGIKNITEREEKTPRLLEYSDILFNLNLTKDQIIDKMQDLYVGILRYKHNRVSNKRFGSPTINIYTDSSNISDPVINSMSDLESFYGFSATDDFSMHWRYDSGHWHDDRGNELNSLSEVGVSYTGEAQTNDNIYFEITQPEETGVRYMPKFNLMNDKYIPLDTKMYCYRLESHATDSDSGEEFPTSDPRHWLYFYLPENASSWSYQDWVDMNPSLWTFLGTWTMSNFATTLNSLRNNYTFSDIDDGIAPVYYPEGDLERFVMVHKNDFSYKWLSLRRCRLYDNNGTRVYAWCEDWDDNSQHVYLTQDPSVIPDHYTGTLKEDDTVENFVDGKTFVERRDDLNYWHFIEDEGEDYTFTSLVDYLRNNTITSGDWYPQDHPSWSCYWLDYPVQPVLLRDCEVMAQKSYFNHDVALVRPGDFVKLKDVVKNGWESILVDGKPVQFRYPMNTAELWLRFTGWQKRCLYKEQREHHNPETEETEYINITPGWKNSLKECFGIWNTDGTPDIFRRRAFGRQRCSYGASGNMGKVSEYIQFNLYTPANITMGTQTNSTPVKTKLTINVASGDSCLRD